MPCCAVKSCKNHPKFLPQNSQIIFHSFPKEDIYKEWLKLVNRTVENWDGPKGKVVCSEHFKESDYYTFFGKKCLRPNALPSVKLDPVIKITMNLTRGPLRRIPVQRARNKMRHNPLMTPSLLKSRPLIRRPIYRILARAENIMNNSINIINREFGMNLTKESVLASIDKNGEDLKQVKNSEPEVSIDLTEDNPEVEEQVETVQQIELPVEQSIDLTQDDPVVENVQQTVQQIKLRVKPRSVLLASPKSKAPTEPIQFNEGALLTNVQQSQTVNLIPRSDLLPSVESMASSNPLQFNKPTTLKPVKQPQKLNLVPRSALLPSVKSVDSNNPLNKTILKTVKQPQNLNLIPRSILKSAVSPVAPKKPTKLVNGSSILKNVQKQQPQTLNLITSNGITQDRIILTPIQPNIGVLQPEKVKIEPRVPPLHTKAQHVAPILRKAKRKLIRVPIQNIVPGTPMGPIIINNQPDNEAVPSVENIISIGEQEGQIIYIIQENPPTEENCNVVEIQEQPVECVEVTETVSSRGPFRFELDDDAIITLNNDIENNIAS